MVVKLRANVSTLEAQVDSLKADLTEVRRSQSLCSADRESIPGFVQTNGADTSVDPRLSFSYVYKRNKTRDWVPAMSAVNEDDDATSQEADVQKDSSTIRCVFRSPERRCYHSCSIAASKGKPADHCVHVHAHAPNSCSEGTTTCNGEMASETTDSSDGDVLNDTLSNLVESNSDNSDQVLDFKVSTVVRCRKHVDVSKSDVKRSAGSAGSTDGQRSFKTSFSCSTQTVPAECVNGWYVMYVMSLLVWAVAVVVDVCYVTTCVGCGSGC